ncbi:MAG: hypothetical protein FK734_06000 [Asgard group archaeon]|nr:hypothetical protein [Asgard group archaeon]
MDLEKIIAYSKEIVDNFLSFTTSDNLIKDESKPTINVFEKTEKCYQIKLRFISNFIEKQKYANINEKHIISYLDNYSDEEPIADLSSELLTEYKEYLINYKPKAKSPEEKISRIIYLYLAKILIKASSKAISESDYEMYASTLINDITIQPKEFTYIIEVQGIEFTSTDRAFKINNDIVLKELEESDFNEIINFAGYFGVKSTTMPKVGLIIRKKEFSGTALNVLAERIRELLQLYYLTDISYGKRFFFIKSMTTKDPLHIHELYKKPAGGRLALTSDNFSRFPGFVQNLLPKLLTLKTNPEKDFLRYSIERFCWALDTTKRADHRLLFAVLAFEPLFLKEGEGLLVENISEKVSERAIQFGKCWRGEQLEAAKYLQQAYHYRNDVAHCNPYPENWNSIFSNITFQVLNYIQEIIIYYLYYFNRDRKNVIDYINKSFIDKTIHSKLVEYVDFVKERLKI